jgi:tetratricopeptide (TPR) repeat protein
MLALGAYGLYVRRGGAVRYAAVAVAFILGLMSKPMVVTLPCVLLLLDYWPLDRVDRAVPLAVMARKTVWLAVEKIPLFLITALSCASTLIMQVRGNNLASSEKIPYAARCANATVVYVLYLIKTVWPSGLAIFYPHPISRPVWQVAGAAVVLVAISLFCLRHARRHPYLIVGWFWYLGTLVPVIELVQAGEFSHADRYTYLPSIGVFVMIAWGVADLATAWHVPKRAVALASGAALVVLAVCAGVQTSYWRNDGTLFGHAIAVGQESALAFGNVGRQAFEEGRYDEARVYLTKGLDLAPDAAGVLISLGALDVNQRRFDEARAHLTKALNLTPDSAQRLQALNNLSALALEQGRADEADTWLREVLKRKPDNVQTLSALGNLDTDRGRNDEAMTLLTKALGLEPENVSVLINLGRLSVIQNRYDEARTYLTKALNLNPKSADALNNLGACLLYQGQYEDGRRHLLKALEIDPQSVSAMKNLSYALTKLGRQEEADAYARKAAELDQARAVKKG